MLNRTLTALNELELSYVEHIFDHDDDTTSEWYRIHALHPNCVVLMTIEITCQIDELDLIAADMGWDLSAHDYIRVVHQGQN